MSTGAPSKPTRAKYRYPWRGGNRFELLVDAEAFFPRMLAAIEGAREYILLEMYLFESGAVAERFIDALVGAAGRDVSVYLLLDAFGTTLTRQDRERLMAPNIRLLHYNPLRFGSLRRNLFRDHRKLLLVDGEVAYVGGAGITDAFQPAEHPERRWHELMTEIRGPVLADWQALFREVWERHAHAPLALIPRVVPGMTPGQLGRVTHTRGLYAQEIKRSLIATMRKAEGRVWIATAYFIPSWKIRRSLRAAARRGVDVRLLLPGPHTDHPAVRHAGRRFYSGLLRNGVRIFEYQPRFLHAKAVLCDSWVSLGSSNFDRWNLHWNLEANQEVSDPGFAAQLAGIFERDFASSEEIRLERWLQRSRYDRLRERVWGWFDLWLDRRLRGRKGAEADRRGGGAD